MNNSDNGAKNKKSKVIVLGFDGATFDLMIPWIKEGKLPTIKRVMDEGVSRVLESTAPPMSATAWVTFLTGVNPGRHGIFEFRIIDPNSYIGFTDSLANSNYVRGNTFIDYVGKNGLRVCSVAIPITYPAWEINGMMVSGTPTPDNSKAYTYPPDLDLGIMTPYPHRKMKLSIKQKRLHGEYEANKRTDILCDAIRSDEYNLYLLHLHTADAAHHNYWRFFDQDCPTFSTEDGYSNYMLESYQILDNQLKKVLNLVDEETPVLIMSDHGGARRPIKQFHFNTWLKQKGLMASNNRSMKANLNTLILKVYDTCKPYLPLQKFRTIFEKNATFSKTFFSVKKNIASINWSETKAYKINLSHPVVGIQINLEGRQENGCVKKDDYNETVDNLIKELLKIKDSDSGVNIIEKAVRKEKLFWGENIDKAPDIILFMHKDYDLSDKNSAFLISDTPRSFFMEKSGLHNMNGIFIAKGPQFNKGMSLKKGALLDITATILYLSGLPIPRNMDSKVMNDIFAETYLKANEIKYTEEAHSNIKDENVSSDDEDQMKEQLRGLGYLE